MCIEAPGGGRACRPEAKTLISNREGSGKECEEDKKIDGGAELKTTKLREWNWFLFFWFFFARRNNSGGWE